jgi:cytochrome c-type biogenesis protein CcmH
VSPTAGRSLALLLTLLAAACSGSSTPPPPDPSPTPATTEGGMRPLTSRQGGDATVPPAAPGTGGTALPPGHPPLEGMPGTPGSVAAAGESVSGTIALADELAARAGTSDVLYVMAKKDGATLAVQRVESPSFPLPFQVSEGHAMVAGTQIEGPVDIVARLSRTGDAIPSPGDLEGTTSSVAVPSEGVTVTIDHVRQ